MPFSKNIFDLRKKAGLSQEEFAARVGVSAKAILNWENGTSLPDGKHLLAVSRAFDVSVDALLSSVDGRIKEEHFDRLFPKKERHEWECYEKALETEYIQCEAEGKEVAPYEGLMRAVAAMPAGHFKSEMADTLFRLLYELPIRADYPYEEPSDYPTIRAMTESVEPRPYDKNSIAEKIRGAWIGRIGGCFLGKGIEGIRTRDLSLLLRSSGNYPMHRYIRQADLTDALMAQTTFRFRRNEKDLWADTTKLLLNDDDTNYTVLSSVIIDEYGDDFTPENVLTAWVHDQPKDAYCTAERVAWMNFVNGYLPPDTAVYKNPYREYIGAQIRVDYYGYICAGDPVAAAEMAYRDASISHVKNGIYGAMYVAAMIARAAVSDDIMDIVRTGLALVPKTSRLYDHVGQIVKLYENGKSIDACRRLVASLYDEQTNYGWCHVLSNAMLVTMALLYHPDDIGAAMCAAVESGFDTDCNGATVGSILGMKCGASHIPADWSAPLAHGLETAIRGYEKVSLDFLVEKTLSHLK